MRNLKRVLSLALALVMVLGMMVITTSAATYADAEEITYQEAVDVMSAIGVLEGDGTNFNPTDTLTREQGAKIICYMLMGKTAAAKLTGSGNFTDVAATRWSAGAIDYCANLGILDGNGDGTFDPTGKLTAVQFGKMLLCALGYDAKIEGYVGKNWATSIATDMIEIGLDVDGVEMNAQLTREQAAEMALYALESTMVWYRDKGTDITIGGTSINTGASAAEVVTADPLVDDYTASAAGDNTLQFVEKYFPSLTLEAGYEDAFGRPSAYSWWITTIAGSYPVYNATRSASMVYTEGFNMKEYNSLLTEGYTFSSTVIDVNGEYRYHGIANVAALAGRDYVGTIVEFFNTDRNAKTIEEAVVIQGYLTKVVNIVSSYDDPTNNYVTLAVYNPWAGSNVVSITLNDDTSKTIPSDYDYIVADYAKNDYMITYWENADVITTNYICAEDVATEVATVESTKYETTNFSGTFVAGGKTYTMASAYAEHSAAGGALRLGGEYTIYLDANGYVVGAISTDPVNTTVNYGIVLAYGTGNKVAANNVSNTPAQEAFENIEIYTAEGKAVVYGTAFLTNAAGVVTPVVGASEQVNGTLVAYTLNEAGKVDSIAAAGDTAGLDGAYTKGTAFTVDGTNYATANTVVFVMTTTGTGTAGAYTKDDIAVFVGYANVPAATYTAGSAVAPAQRNPGALTVTATTLPGATTKAQYVMFTDGVATKTATAITGVYQWTYSAVIDGTATSVYYLAGSEPSVTAGQLGTITFDATTGAVASVTPVVADIDEIVVDQDSFYVDNAVVYTDEDTVFYQLKGVFSGSSVTRLVGFAAADGITLANAGMGETFDVYEYYVVDSNSDGVAEVVFFYVYQA